MPEFDREGRAVGHFWLKLANTMRLPQTRKLVRSRAPPGGPSDPPFLKGSYPRITRLIANK